MEFLVPQEEAERLIRTLNNNPTLEDIQAVFEEADRFDLPYVKAEANKRMGDIYFDSGKYHEAVYSYIEALDLYGKLSINCYHGYMYNRLGICKSNDLDRLEALTYFNKSYVYSNETGDKVTLKKCIYNLGRCYKKLERYDAAIQCLSEYINIVDRNSEFKSFAYAYILMANCYESKNQIQKTLDIYDSLIAMCKDNDDELLGYIYNNLGVLYLGLRRYDESIEYFDLAISKKKDKNISSLAFTCVSKAEVFIKKGDYNTAMELVYNSLSLLKEKPDEDLEIKTYYTLAEIYLLTDDDSKLKNTYLYLTTLLKADRINDLVKLYAKLAEMALKEQDNESCKKYIKMIQDI